MGQGIGIVKKGTWKEIRVFRNDIEDLPVEAECDGEGADTLGATNSWRRQWPGK